MIDVKNISLKSLENFVQNTENVKKIRTLAESPIAKRAVEACDEPIDKLLRACYRLGYQVALSMRNPPFIEKFIPSKYQSNFRAGVEKDKKSFLKLRHAVNNALFNVVSPVNQAASVSVIEAMLTRVTKNPKALAVAMPARVVLYMMEKSLKNKVAVLEELMDEQNKNKTQDNTPSPKQPKMLCAHNNSKLPHQTDYQNA